MGLFSIITGAGKVGAVVDTGLDVIKSSVKGIDALVFTDEERALAAAENTVRAMGHVEAMAKIQQAESGASAITRRVIAIMLIGMFCIFSTVSLIFVCIGSIAIVQNIISLAEKLSIGAITMTIVVSMFGYYGITGAAKTFKK